MVLYIGEVLVKNILMQMFIEALCKPRAIVIDVTASTGVFAIFMPTINIQ
jgi:hypothetical protein